jgi:hypothetical protein
MVTVRPETVAGTASGTVVVDDDVVVVGELVVVLDDVVVVAAVVAVVGVVVVAAAVVVGVDVAVDTDDTVVGGCVVVEAPSEDRVPQPARPTSARTPIAASVERRFDIPMRRSYTRGVSAASLVDESVTSSSIE